MTLKTVLKYTISLGIAASLLWYVFKGIDFEAMLNTFRAADYTWISLAILLTVIAHGSRAYRWGLLLEPVIGKRPTPFHTTLSVLTGYFANLIIPRMGEVTRCGTLNRLEGVPVNVSFGTVVAERIFDLVVLLLILVATFLIEFDRLSTFFLDFFSSKLNLSGLRDPSWPLVIVVASALGFFVLVWSFYQRYREILRQKPFFQRVKKFTSGLVEGLMAIRKLRNPGAFLFHTVLIWSMYYFTTYVLFFSLPETSGLGWRTGLTILAMSAISMAAPVQGGIGPFHLLVGNALILYGLTQQDGIVLATFLHAVQTIVQLVLGGLSFLVLLFKSNRSVTDNVSINGLSRSS